MVSKTPQACYINLNNQCIRARRLINPAKRLALSNVSPIIPNERIATELTQKIRLRYHGQRYFTRVFISLKNNSEKKNNEMSKYSITTTKRCITSIFAAQLSKTPNVNIGTCRMCIHKIWMAAPNWVPFIARTFTCDVISQLNHRNFLYSSSSLWNFYYRLRFYFSRHFWEEMSKGTPSDSGKLGTLMSVIV